MLLGTSKSLIGLQSLTLLLVSEALELVSIVRVLLEKRRDAVKVYVEDDRCQLPAWWSCIEAQ